MMLSQPTAHITKAMLDTYLGISNDLRYNACCALKLQKFPEDSMISQNVAKFADRSPDLLMKLFSRDASRFPHFQEIAICIMAKTLHAYCIDFKFTLQLIPDFGSSHSLHLILVLLTVPTLPAQATCS